MSGSDNADLTTPAAPPSSNTPENDPATALESTPAFVRPRTYLKPPQSAAAIMPPSPVDREQMEGLVRLSIQLLS